MSTLPVPRVAAITGSEAAHDVNLAISHRQLCNSRPEPREQQRLPTVGKLQRVINYITRCNLSVIFFFQFIYGLIKTYFYIIDVVYDIKTKKKSSRELRSMHGSSYEKHNNIPDSGPQ